MTTHENTPEVVESWRESSKAIELRDYIDKFFNPKQAGMKHLDRELVIDFVEKEITSQKQKQIEEIVGIAEGMRWAFKSDETNEYYKIEVKTRNRTLDDLITKIQAKQ